MKTYNDIVIPPLIRVDRILSAFVNHIDYNKVMNYALVMNINGLNHDFPPIKGYPGIIDENDIGQYFLNEKEVDETHLGCLVWFVTDGHHRTLAAIEANLPHLETEIDYNCITTEKDLKQFENS